jgi:hypothetical protein
MMTDSNERAAERLDKAIDQRRAGAIDQSVADVPEPELASLLNLAARLDRELPPDLPDPAFREQLKQNLLGPSRKSLRGRQFFNDWRFGVAAAALVGVVLIIVIFGSGALKGDSSVPPARETVVSALSGSDKGTEAAGQTGTPRTVEDTAVFPPIDQDHVVQVPLAASVTPPPVGTPEPQPTPGIVAQTPLPVLPQTARTWLLTGPEVTQSFLETLIARTGISGVIKPSSSDGPNAFVVDDPTGFAAIHWNQHDAYFRYDRGPNEPTPPPIRATTNPLVSAEDWLSEIGFDLTTITYKESAEVISGQTIVRFEPTNLPAAAIAPGLGVTVGVGPDGSIQFAQGFWLSLGESAEVHLRTSQAMLDAANGGEWFAPTVQQTNQLSLNVNSAKLTYLLTRADDSSFLLQPVISFGGSRWTASGDVPAEIFVSAIQK